MIIEYHRPASLNEANELLARTNVSTVPLGGGTYLNQSSIEQVAAIDLQSLGLDKIEVQGKNIIIGATVTLQQLYNFEVERALKTALRLEATYNLRQVATIAGTLVASNGRSPFGTAILALDAKLDILQEKESASLGNYLLLRCNRKSNHLITQITIQENVKLAFEYVSRTPADQPIVCVAVALWSSGRTRVSIGGYGIAPMLAMDGSESAGAEEAAWDAYREASDEWASAKYRGDMARVLTRRCIQTLSSQMK